MAMAMASAIQTGKATPLQADHQRLAGAPHQPQCPVSWMLTSSDADVLASMPKQPANWENSLAHGLPVSKRADVLR